MNSFTDDWGDNPVHLYGMWYERLIWNAVHIAEDNKL